ncbi:Fungalysin metallopeptidase-domain-containing protein [Suillus plorans]|uniref:Extracellular metalloproteinase n=1 Tax=Suillus plorans TaxID=116603 RepID=A0A9P7AY21_9AGAM|nr:Fungalysin metallopeptidase-domain-containing protein [Suillus plorans]KAG1796395.1 Fungalysin metallopeptidase-domain-containing protein [Suillus plorans]
MRGLTTVTLALLGLAAAIPEPQRRKSLSFGPVLPHAHFDSSAHQPVPAVLFSTQDRVRVDPYEVAKTFLDSIVDLDDGVSYVIRSDSYTDRITGVTHVYARQIVQGVQVADGNVNLNIKDGVVLSYGNSFYPGPAPSSHTRGAHPHAEYCAQLDSARSPWSSQKPLDGAHPELEHIHSSNCAALPNIHSIPTPSFDDHVPSPQDAPRALLTFLLAAAPSPALAQDIQTRFDDHLASMTMAHMSGFLPHEAEQLTITGAPGTIGEVKTSVVWVQVPSEDGTVHLELVHRFEVEMEHNWYETTVSASLPHRIVSVVDWASDSPMPLYSPGSHPEDAQLPPLSSFIPAGSNAPSCSTKKVGGRFRKGKAVADLRKSKAAKEGVTWSSGPAIPDFPKAYYNIFPWGTNDPVEAAERKALSEADAPTDSLPPSYGRVQYSELGDKLASPAGWHALPWGVDPSISEEEKVALRAKGEFWRTTNTTWGNNVFAHENWEGRNAWIYNRRPEGISVGDDVSTLAVHYNYPYSPSQKGNSEENLVDAHAHIDATVAQLFYTSNLFHDLTYRYGFTEEAGNFQQYNFGRGGEESDAVITNAQDGSGFNNANFMTPPDGQNGKCRMYLWNTANPYRDGDMEAGIVIHELTHGLSTRLTGGPKNSGCLGWGEAGGMGEGWGDFLATTIRSTATYEDYAMGAWAANRPGGIRNYPYSLDKSVNPSTYKTLDKPGYWGVHAIGEVWAQMLWVLEQRLIAKHGFTDNLFPPPHDANFADYAAFYRADKPFVPKHGNSLLVQLVLNGMKLQPCSPSFFDARDAIVQADQVLTGGENFCDIWAGFVESGLGIDATVKGRTPWGGGVREDGYKVPAACQSEDAPSPSPEPIPDDPEDDCGPFGCWWKL